MDKAIILTKYSIMLKYLNCKKEIRILLNLFYIHLLQIEYTLV